VLPGGGLSVVLTPTPRWPDLICLYDADQKVMFTSKLFSAHVAPALAGTKVRKAARRPPPAAGKSWWRHQQPQPEAAAARSAVRLAGCPQPRAACLGVGTPQALH
jgi:hypothetical protein